MMSSYQRQTETEGREASGSAAIIVCQCSNVCNRAVGRGSCPCLKSDRSCSQLCKCGTAKMGCKNMISETELEPPEEDGITIHKEKTREEKSIQREPQTRKRWKRKKVGAQRDSRQYHKKARGNISEVKPWLSVSDSGEHAYCCLCECHISIDKGETSLLEHNQCEKHTQRAKSLPLKGKIESKKQEQHLKSVLEEMPQFKPWLRLNKITGNAYCLYCRSEIVRGKSLKELDRHKNSQRHLMSKQMDKSVRKAIGGQSGHANSLLENYKMIFNESATLDSEDESISAHFLQERQEGDMLEERQEGDMVQERQEGDVVEEREMRDLSQKYKDDKSISLFLSDEVINNQVKEAEAQVASFVVENCVPLEVTEDLIAMLKRLPTAGTVIGKMKLGDEFALNVIKHTTDDLLNKFLVENLKTTLFSIVLDSQTNQSGVAYLGIFAFYCNRKFETQIVLFDIAELCDQSAEMIFNKLKRSLQTKEKEGILLGNWISFLCNSTNIPFDLMVSVMGMVKQHYPWVMPVVSPSHMAEVSIIAAIKHLPRQIEHVCELLHNHFVSGPVQAASFLNYTRFIAVKDHKILADQHLPWTASYEYLLNLLEQWKRLKIYFTNAETIKPDSDSRLILEFLNNPMMHMFLVVLQFLSGLVLNYQSKISLEEPIFQNINIYTDKLVRMLGNFFMIRDVVMIEDMSKLDVTEEASYLPMPQIYLGVEGSSALAAYMEQGQLTFEDQNIAEFLHTVREFYKEFIQNLQINLQFCQSLWCLGKIINPRNLVTAKSSTYVNSDVFNTFLASDLVDIKEFSRELQVIQSVTLPDTDEMSPRSCWDHILMSSTEAFQHVRGVISFFFSLPVSSPSTSKIFESLKEWNVDAGMRFQMANIGEYLKENVFINELFEGHCFKQWRNSEKK